MATKRISSIDIIIQVRAGVIRADASVTWTAPELPEIPPQSIPVALTVGARQTIADIIAACDAAAEAQLQRGGDTIEKPTRPDARAVMEGPSR